MSSAQAAEPQEGDGLRPASQAQRLRRLWELETVSSPVPAWPVETSQSLRAPGKQDLIKQKGFCTRDLPGLPGSPGMEPHSQFKAGVFSDFSGASSEPRDEDTQLSSLVLPLLHRPSLGHLTLSVTSQISLLTQRGTGTSQAPPAQVLQTKHGPSAAGLAFLLHPTPSSRQNNQSPSDPTLPLLPSVQQSPNPADLTSSTLTWPPS